MRGEGVNDEFTMILEDIDSILEPLHREGEVLAISVDGYIIVNHRRRLSLLSRRRQLSIPIVMAVDLMNCKYCQNLKTTTTATTMTTATMEQGNWIRFKSILKVEVMT